MEKTTPLQYPGMRSLCAKNAKARLYGICFRDKRRQDCLFATSNGPSAVVQFHHHTVFGEPYCTLLGLDLVVCAIDSVPPDHEQREIWMLFAQFNKRS
jgi:hypothetical protein